MASTKRKAVVATGTKDSPRRVVFGGKKYLSLCLGSARIAGAVQVPGLRLPQHFSDNRAVTRKANSTAR